MTQLKLIQQGAEAKIFLDEKENLIIKDRISKSYRIPELDNKIIKQRTKAETKLLIKANQIINAPLPEKSKEHNKIIMHYIQGEKLSTSLNEFSLEKQKQIMKKIGESIASLHKSDIIHGDLTTSNMILVSNNSNEFSQFNKQLSELKKLNLPVAEYAIFGSGPLTIHGIRDSRDMDIIVKEGLWNKLIKKYPVTETYKKFIRIGEIEIYKDWEPWFNDVDKLINDADIFDEIRFVKLKDVMKWKKAFGREKDKEDIQLIEKYLKRNDDNNLEIYFIDFGLGYISKKIEDKAVDIHLLKQALEAKHFLHWKELFEEFTKAYSKSYLESKQIFERMVAIERRGRYRH
jgi:tRNA A-37 threonylcarbamoyl transferase component Bud32